MNDADKNPVMIEDLHAYADGQLAPGRAIEVEAYLQQHPDAAAQVLDYRSINTALREAFAQEQQADGATAPSLARIRPAPLRMALAACLAGVLVGGAMGWVSHGYFLSDAAGMRELAQRAGAAYVVYGPDSTHPVEMVAAESDRLAAWFSNRMNMTFQIPRLAAMGFTLVGGRLMAGNTAPAAMLMYENGQGRRIVLYVRNDLPDNHPTKMRYEHSNSGGIVTWKDAKAGFGLAGGFSEQELAPVANLIRAEFSS